MIKRILVVAQGPNDLGFLTGLRDRLGCDAEFIDSRTQPTCRQRASYTRKADARLIWSQRGNVDIVVRLTDGDQINPQTVYDEEVARWPVEAKSLLVCGVCDRDVEHWMCLDPAYASARLRFDLHDLPTRREDRSGFIKNRIASLRGNQTHADFVASFVRDAPQETIRRWLQNTALASFYDQCREIANRHDCPVLNLRDRSED